MGNSSGSRNRGAHSREAGREPRVNFKEPSNRGSTYGYERERGKSSRDATGSPRIPRTQTELY